MQQTGNLFCSPYFKIMLIQIPTAFLTAFSAMYELLRVLPKRCYVYITVFGLLM